MICTICHHEKSPDAFGPGRRQCKRCRLDRKLARYDPVKQKAINDRASWKVRASRYGLSEAELRAMWDAQEHRCAICDRSERMDHPHVDHCHATKRVRGFLCASCNRMLGLARDSPAHLREAAAYLER